MKRLAPLTLVFLAAPLAAMAGGPAVPTIEPQVTAPAPAAPVTPSVDWTGFYSGLSLGGGHSYGNSPGTHANLGVAGVNLGYRYDMGPVLVGGEFSYDKDNINVGQASGSKVNNSTALKLVVGKSLGNTLVYGTVGLAQADASVAGVSGSDTGYTAGIGADYALNQQWTLGGELAGSRYNNFKNTGYDLKDTTFKVKIGFRF
ncbi:outer membrane beta-barrel protein [bacterium]|nr:outer membrane beta-barrel protein [bacterium]